MGYQGGILLPEMVSPQLRWPPHPTHRSPTSAVRVAASRPHTPNTIPTAAVAAPPHPPLRHLRGAHGGQPLLAVLRLQGRPQRTQSRQRHAQAGGGFGVAVVRDEGNGGDCGGEGTGSREGAEEA